MNYLDDISFFGERDCLNLESVLLIVIDESIGIFYSLLWLVPTQTMPLIVVLV